MNSFLETYGKVIFTLVIIAILIAFAHLPCIRIKEYTIRRINCTNQIGTDEITKVTNGKENNNEYNKSMKPTDVVDEVYCIYFQFQHIFFHLLKNLVIFLYH